MRTNRNTRVSIENIYAEVNGGCNYVGFRLTLGPNEPIKEVVQSTSKATFQIYSIARARAVRKDEVAYS